MSAFALPSSRSAGAVALLLGCLQAGSAVAHFQELVPSSDLVTPQSRSVTFEIVFTHPAHGGPTMAMEPPVRFGVLHQETVTDLTDRLLARTVDDQAAYTASYDVTAPGDHVFFLEPAPYLETSENVYIQQFAKVVVEAFGAEQGWDTLVGLPAEIRPLVRPYGLWTGNIFRGVVLSEGEPVPFAEIEVEYRNTDGVVFPAAAFGTQVILADASGTFDFVMPRAGWWGFCALGVGPQTEHEGLELSQDAVFWVRTVDVR
ncbi:MAG: DUF4198 domain-containing protein [Rhodospirillaceae bacterium]|nr:DUF4198 domain-containing protein [Rhodospirillaceae bacterium]